MIEWKLHLKMAEKRMRIADLARATKVAPETIAKYYHGKGVDGVKMKTLEKFCQVLECQPGDLMYYIPEVRGEE